MEGILAPGREDLGLERLERGVPERASREPGRVLHVPHPVAIVDLLAGDLLGRG